MGLPRVGSDPELGRLFSRTDRHEKMNQQRLGEPTYWKPPKEEPKAFGVWNRQDVLRMRTGWASALLLLHLPLIFVTLHDILGAKFGWQHWMFPIIHKQVYIILLAALLSLFCFAWMIHRLNQEKSRAAAGQPDGHRQYKTGFGRWFGPYFLSLSYMMGRINSFEWQRFYFRRRLIGLVIVLLIPIGYVLYVEGKDFINALMSGGSYQGSDISGLFGFFIPFLIILPALYFWYKWYRENKKFV